ncbi:MAG: MBL fold metallo-hydrolase [Pseudohongiellaceae bacterium]
MNKSAVKQSFSIVDFHDTPNLALLQRFISLYGSYTELFTGSPRVREGVVFIPTIVKATYVLGLLLMLAMAQGQAAEPAFFRILPLAGDVFMLEASDGTGNMAVLSGPEGMLLVDSRFPQDSDALWNATREIGSEPVRYVINTHVHPDHIGGNQALAARGSLIIAHERVRTVMLSEIRIPRRGGVFYPRPPAEALPDITFAESMVLHLNSETVRIFLAPPAHTGGDAFVHFVEADVLHLGDVFRTNMYPIIDHYNGGSFLGMIEAMELAIEIAGPQTQVIPGHGFGATDRDGLIAVHAMLLDFRDRVQALLDRGFDLEQVLAAAPLASYDERWGQVPSWTATDLLPIIVQELQP